MRPGTRDPGRTLLICPLFCPVREEFAGRTLASVKPRSYRRPVSCSGQRSMNPPLEFLVGQERSASRRSQAPGYLELLTLMDRDEVGIVLVQDLSRLSRKRSDSALFLEHAEEQGTLIYTNGAVHDPSSGDLAATLGLDMAGAFGNYDNRARAGRMKVAKLAKAKRGRPVSPPPVGYVRTSEGSWEKDLDRTVQDAIHRAFDQYEQLGSLGKVVAYFRENGLEFPRRHRGRVRWGPGDAALLHSTLRNRAYCGDYIYLRRHTKKRSDGSGVIVKFRPSHEWIVKPDNHPAYIPREAWQRIQDKLASRRPTLRPLTGKGSALLQGLLRCGALGCWRWMKTHYWGRDGVARTASYTCTRQDGWGVITHKVIFPARLIEHTVIKHVLEAITTIDEETARNVIERTELERATLERAQRRRLLDAEEDVQRIRRLLLALPAEHQHARTDLMAQYDLAVAQHLALKSQLALENTSALSVTSADIGDLLQLTSDIRHLWHAPQRTNAERKQLLQTVISEIIVHHADRDRAELEIVWKGGLRERLAAYRARGLEAVVAGKTLEGKSGRAIAKELNAAGAVTAVGQPISTQLVTRKQRRQGLHPERRAPPGSAADPPVGAGQKVSYIVSDSNDGRSVTTRFGDRAGAWAIERWIAHPVLVGP